MKKLKKSTVNNIVCYGIVILFYLVVQILLSQGKLSSSMQGMLVPICCYIIMAVSLNLTVGVLGELSLGHAGFMSIGAFVGTIACFRLTEVVPFAPVRLAISIVIGALCAGVAGLLIGIPVLRLNGDYLAIVTLAFGEIIKNIITCLYVGMDSKGLHFGFLTSISALNMEEGAKTILNGPVGITGISKISSFSAGVVLIFITLFIVLNMVRSRTGRAILAVRDNYIAAESVGINVAKYKMVAFTTSAALAGAAGTLYAMSYSTIVATRFDFNTSILILVFVVLGGLGNMWGSIISAAVLTVLPELLRGFESYRMLVYAIVLILVMLITNSPFFKNLWVEIKGRIKGKSEDKISDGVSEGGADA